MQSKTQPFVEKLVQSGTMGGSAADGDSVWNVSVYCNNSQDWYVVASIHQAQGKKNRYFRVGKFDSEQIAFEKAKAVVPEKLSKAKKVGTIDLYRNRTWRVRIKYVKENLHIGYFIKKKDAHKAILKLMNDTKYLSSRCEDLNRKRQQSKVRSKRMKLDAGGEELEYATGKKRWTKDDIDLLTKLRDQSTPWQNVARRLGRTIEACKSRIWRQSSENLRDEKDHEYHYTEPKRQSRRKIAVKEESGRLSIPRMRFSRNESSTSWRATTPPRLPIKRRLEEDSDARRSRKRQANWNSQALNYSVKTEMDAPFSPYTFNVSNDNYPTSPRLDDDDNDDISAREWFSEVKRQPCWSEATLSFELTEPSFPNTYFDFLKDDNPVAKSASESEDNASLFEIPSSSLNVEVKEEVQFDEPGKDPWKNFFFRGSNIFLPRFNVALAAKVNDRTDWWVAEK